MPFTKQFKIATRETGVNGDLSFKSKKVFIKDSDVPKFDEHMAWSELVDVCALVHDAKEQTQSEKTDAILDNLTVFGDTFFTKAMAEALFISDLHTGALAVQMDDPIDLWIALDRYVRKEVKPVLHFQPETGINFIQGAGNMWDALAMPAIQMGLNQAFAVKWSRLVARPQEVIAASLADEKIAPSLFRASIRGLVDEDAVLKDPRKFTIYDEGCPLHSAYISGHSNYSGVVYALLCLKYGLQENRNMHNEMAQTLLSFAHCRSAAGVHYFQDSIEGFKLGVLAVQRGLVDLAISLGLDDEYVSQIAQSVENLTTEWVK